MSQNVYAYVVLYALYRKKIAANLAMVY